MEVVLGVDRGFAGLYDDDAECEVYESFVWHGKNVLKRLPVE